MCTLHIQTAGAVYSSSILCGSLLCALCESGLKVCGGKLYYENCALVGYCCETSVRNHHHPKERSSHLLCGGSLISRKLHCSFLEVMRSL
jgi:hypothetical protein